MGSNDFGLTMGMSFQPVSSEADAAARRHRHLMQGAPGFSLLDFGSDIRH